MAVATARRPILALAAVTYLLMVAVNVLANALPINGVRTGDVSDAYPNLFAPAGYTFSIWGLIYLLLGLHLLHRFGLFQGGPAGTDQSPVLDRVGLYFSISSVANAAWILAWHHDAIELSVVLMLVILVCLAAITRLLAGAQLAGREKLLVAVPFSVYFGWITVATVANVIVLLVSLGSNGFGPAEPSWTIAMVVAAAVFGTLVMLRNRDVAYGLVLLWAYTGILAKHLSASGFDAGYPSIVGTVIACLAVFVTATAVLIFRRGR